MVGSIIHATSCLNSHVCFLMMTCSREFSHKFYRFILTCVNFKLYNLKDVCFHAVQQGFTAFGALPQEYSVDLCSVCFLSSL